MSVKGFISKKYNIIMNLPIEKVSEVKPSKSYELEISSNGKTYRIDTYEVSAKRIQQAINEIREIVVVS